MFLRASPSRAEQAQAGDNSQLAGAVGPGCWGGLCGQLPAGCQGARQKGPSLREARGAEGASQGLPRLPAPPTSLAVPPESITPWEDQVPGKGGPEASGDIRHATVRPSPRGRRH